MNIRYEIHVHGLLGPVLRTAFADVQCVAVARRTTIRGRMSGEKLRQLLNQLDQCGVELERVCAQEDDGGGQSFGRDEAADRSS